MFIIKKICMIIIVITLLIINSVICYADYMDYFKNQTQVGEVDEDSGEKVLSREVEGEFVKTLYERKEEDGTISYPYSAIYLWELEEWDKLTRTNSWAIKSVRNTRDKETKVLRKEYKSLENEWVPIEDGAINRGSMDIEKLLVHYYVIKTKYPERISEIPQDKLNNRSLKFTDDCQPKFIKESIAALERYWKESDEAYYRQFEAERKEEERKKAVEMEILNNQDYRNSVEINVDNNNKLPSGNKYTNLSKISIMKKVSAYPKYATIDKMDTVTFGSYPQSSPGSKEPIEWIVLDEKNGEALLLSKYILDCKSFCEPYVDATWETSLLRNWLNNDFYNKAFTDDEKNKIKSTLLKTEDNTKYGIKGSNDTNDKVFSLSIKECHNYFGNEDSDGNNFRLATRGTNYAKSVENFDYNLMVLGGNTFWSAPNSIFLLRSPGGTQITSAVVNFFGQTEYIALNYGTIDFAGVRPAIWVKYK